MVILLFFLIYLQSYNGYISYFLWLGTWNSWCSEWDYWKCWLLCSRKNACCWEFIWEVSLYQILLVAFMNFFCALLFSFVLLFPLWLVFTLQNLVFGWSAFVHVHSHHQGELDSQALKCFFIGYVSDKKGYRYYHPESCEFMFRGCHTSWNLVILQYSSAL